jgi:translocation and assembly module TamB
MKALRIALWGLGATLLTGLALIAALWSWTSHDSSLSAALRQAARFLPAGQSLEVKDVEGSLRSGGRIGWLRWQQGDLSVEASDIRLAWTARALLDRELRLSQVAVRHLRIDDRRAPSAPTPPTNLGLPFKVDAAFTVETLDWMDPPAVQLSGLAGHYTFDQQLHTLTDATARLSSGSYQLNGRLQAQAPMAVTLQLQGAVQTTLPASQQPLTVQAHAQVQGTLAGPDAALDITARLVPERTPTPPPSTLKTGAKPALQASLSARIQPWQQQRIASADAQWQSLDLAALWPQAPQTQLSGNAHVTPSGTGWRAGLQLSNAFSGPWDQQRLPLSSLNANVVYLAGLWTVESLQATGAGGHLEAQGKLADTPAQWQGRASVTGINPAQLDSRLASTVLNGQLTARQTPAGIAFETQLQAASHPIAAKKTDSPGLKTLAGLRLKTAHLLGLWQAPRLTLSQLDVQTDDAQLQGKLSFDTQSQATTGQLTLTLPGASAGLDGHIASTQGQGELTLRVADAALTSRWLARWPGSAAAWGQTSLQGSAELSGQWQGGWQQQGRALHIKASLRAPQLDLFTAPAPANPDWRLRDVLAELSGTLPALSLTARGQASQASRQFALQTQAHGGRINDGTWQVSVDAAQLTAQDTLKPGLWTVKLNQRLDLDWTQSGRRQSLKVAAGSAQLTGPVPGAAALSWQPAQWTQKTTGTEWQTQGTLTGLPLAWMELLGQTQIANLGLRGDLLFGGQWDATGGETLRLRAVLERTSGDLQLQTGDGSVATGPLRAGVREARLQITSAGDQVSASLRWDSERAGQAQAEFSTRLQRQDGGWRLPADAPVKGTLRAKLPPVGAWSVLAPPGWRLSGTLDADATLSGTLGTPLWRGSLQAQNLSVRSVVDGLDFSNGSLRASLDGQRLNIDHFTLQGAGGSNGGGTLSATGSVLWLPATEASHTTASRLRMTLDATAQVLRMSTRADRRLVVSGQITAQLAEARLEIRGKVKADQALFTLPEDTTPQLGSDVVVRTSAADQARKATAAQPKPTTLRVTPDVAITLDLGSDFQVRGRGLNTRLAGVLELSSGAGSNAMPRLVGTLRTVRGTYKAYGQQLDIEQGVLRFFGPYDNPVLDILAIRPNLQQRVGVQINGTALSPLVRLYAEPDLPDAEKLAWLVLGRSAANGGAEAAVLQQAALALLGGNGKSLSGSLMEALGLDELSMRGATSSADGSTATGATVTLGKRLTRDFYVAYERSLAGTLGTFYIFYDLSRRFTLRAQTGEQSAVDLIFTLRYD